MRIMGLDFGSRTCGVALTDELLLTAQPKEIIRRERPSQLRKTLQRIEELIGENNVGMIVLGLPLNMDDSQGERATLTLEFQDKLQRRTGLPVVMSDERLTTVEADELMDEMGIRGADRKKYVDMLAAAVILRDYMNSHPEKLEELRGM
ncbi:MAG: Holliday junction resolvase RuvX [Lachnospiraceae bacterium]|nr:Holliday junction resolvase RuvX [Lachnospiraceae bacterium]